MKNEAQIIAIAEACGVGIPAWAKEREQTAWWSGEPGESEFTELPDYPRDLNAMHEAEKVLKNDQQWPYVQALFRVLEEQDILSSSFATMHATAAQRTEAFLRTIGKWRDEA